MDWGAIIAGAFGGGATAVGSLADDAMERDRKQKLMELQNTLEIQKNQAAAQHKQRMEDEQRQRVAGVVQGAAQRPVGVDDESGGHSQPLQEVNPNAARRAGVNALAQQGYMAEASTYDKILDSGKKVVGNGQVLLDEDNKPIYDNSLAKQQAMLMDAETRRMKVEGAGKPKALDQAQIDKLVQQGNNIVERQTQGMTNPFATALDDKESRQDFARSNALKGAVTRVIEGAAQNGALVNPAEVLHKLNPIMKAADQQVIQQANEQAGKIFDKSGKPIPEVMQPLLQQGAIPPMAATDANSFRRWYRDEKLPDAFQALVDNAWRSQRGGGGKPNAAAPDTSAAGASNGEATEPPTSAPVAAPSTAARAAPTSSGADRYRGSSYAQNQPSEDDQDTNLRTRIRNDAQRQEADGDPDLQRWLDMSKRFLTAGRAADANGAINRYKQMRQQRYGF